MNKAFVAEFGFTMIEIKEFHQLITEIGFSQKKQCASLSLSKLKDSIKEAAQNIPDWTDDKIEKAIQLFSLKYRGKWDFIPKGFEPSDIRPWRYNRRLSYLSRPLVIGIENNQEQVVFWGPRHVEEACMQLFSNISSGRYKIHAKSSDAMKQYLGHLTEKAGEEFNQEVKNWFENNSDWIIKKNIPINSGTLLRANSDLGDVDILAVDTLERKIYSIECKNVNFGRNAREMASEIERFFSGTEPWAEKHIKRHEWLIMNLSTVSLLFKIDLTKYSLSSFFLVSEEIPAPYLYSGHFPFISFPQLKNSGIKKLQKI
jgi:hypothetical protein